MPHATGSVVNGEKASSQFISHLTSYPAVSDGIETFKANPYGKKSLEIVDGAYTRFGKPVEPYLETPYAYAKPYVQKADELADSGLGRVETHFPIVKENTGTIVETAKGYAFWPYTYLSGTWNDEYTKTAKHNDRGPGLTTSALAIVSTELRIAADFFHAVADFLGPRYEATKKQGADYAKQLEDTAVDYKKVASEKISELTKAGEQKKDEVKDQAKKTKDEAGKKVDEAGKKADEVGKEAQKKASK